MMMGLKQARLAYAIEINKINEARDSAVDICGYAALIEKMGFIQEGSE